MRELLNGIYQSNFVHNIKKTSKQNRLFLKNVSKIIEYEAIWNLPGCEVGDDTKYLSNYSVCHVVKYDTFYHTAIYFNVGMNANKYTKWIYIFRIFSLITNWNKLRLSQVGFCTSLFIIFKKYECISRHFTKWRYTPLKRLNLGTNKETNSWWKME